MLFATLTRSVSTQTLPRNVSLNQTIRPTGFFILLLTIENVCAKAEPTTRLQTLPRHVSLNQAILSNALKCSNDRRKRLRQAGYKLSLDALA